MQQPVPLSMLIAGFVIATDGHRQRMDGCRIDRGAENGRLDTPLLFGPCPFMVDVMCVPRPEPPFQEQSG